MTSDINGPIEDLKSSELVKDFKEIFCNKHMSYILKERTAFTNLWYHCMSQLLMMDGDRIFSEKSNSHRFKYSIHNTSKLLEVIKPSFHSLIHSEQQKITDNHVDVLFISRDRFVKAYTTDGWITSDYLFFSVIQGLKHECPNIKIALLCTSEPPLDLNIDAYNVYRYIKPQDFFRSLLFSCKKVLQWTIHRKKIKRNINSNSHHESVLFRRTDLFFSFRMLFARYLVDYSYHRLFATLKPKIVISNDDTMQLKPVTAWENMKFITVQSAIMSPVNELYRRLFISQFGDESIKSDYFICTGECFKELKEYSNVAKKVVVMGQPRYDILTLADKIYDKKKIVSDLGLDPNKKIVLWCTQTHGQSLDENVSSINAVYSTMVSIKDYAQLLIKLHPGEDQHAPLYHENTLYQPMILNRDVDIYALLSICDLVITKNSTTAMEAVILNKPVIILNLSGEPDRVNYVREGVALGVYDPENLSSAIGKLLDDGSILHEKREEYIKKYLYKVDGKATERVLELIKSLLEESKTS